MRKMGMIACVTGMLAAGALLPVGALAMMCDGCGPDGFGGPPGMSRHDGKHMEFMGKRLGLSDDQKAQIKEIFAAEKTAAEPLRKALDEGRQKLHQIAKTLPFDESAFRAQAAALEPTRLDMMVLRAKTHSQVQAVLTPEQRDKAEKLREMKPRKGKKRPGT